ncbi:MAG: hypothetical protein ACRYFK_00240 [Janthinobacterium lividum]
MITFDDTHKLVNRILLPVVGILSESIRNKIAQDDNNALLKVQKLISIDYKLFKTELDKNLSFLDREDYVSYLNETASLFTVPIVQLQNANDLAQQLVLKHGNTYQDIAWIELKSTLQSQILNNEATSKACILLMIATGGLGYYQAAYGEVERLLRLYDRKLPQTSKASILKTKYSAGITDLWQGLLVPGFTLSDLDQLLVKIGIIDNASSLSVTSETKPGSWVGVMHALKESKKLTTNNKAKIYRAIMARYKPESFSSSSFRNYNADNQFSNSSYNRAKAFL